MSCPTRSSTWPENLFSRSLLPRRPTQQPSFAKASEGILHSSEGATQDGGARRDRTDDLMLAKHALYQLSYGPLKKPRPIGSLSDLFARGKYGGPRQTRTADLTLIRRVL